MNTPKLEKKDFLFFETDRIDYFFKDYGDLGCKIKSLLVVCSHALTNDSEKIDRFYVGEVLDLVSNLIPQDEFYLLDKFKEITQEKQDLNEI